MSKEIPFDEDTMTLIMGLGGPQEPGQHGRREVPAPEKDTVDLITQIRDLCEEFLAKLDKGGDKPSAKPETGEDDTTDEGEEEK